MRHRFSHRAEKRSRKEPAVIGGDILGERARLTPDKVALIQAPEGKRFTYRELDARAILLAAYLTGHYGLNRGDRLGILSENRPEYVDAFFAAGKTGIVLVPLSTRFTASELTQVVHDCGMRALLYSEAYADTAKSLPVDIAISLDAIPSDASAAFHSCRCHPEDLYCLLYTSGTTGKPKGVMLPHRMILWNGYNTVASWQLRDNDCGPVFTPLYHAGGLAVLLVPLFVIGGTVVLHKRFDASEVWRTIERERCTVVFGVPAIFKMLLEAPEFAAADFSHVRWCISGGAPLPQYIIDAFQKRGVVFKQGYGLTEAGVNCFAMTAEDSQRKPGSIGKPMLFTEARLTEAGELLLRGPHVSKGYWNQAGATAAAIDTDGWLHTGDIARCDDEGFFYICGRLKDMFISGGVNVYPAEIEAQLLQHPEIEDAAVVGVPHEKWGEAGMAFLVRRKGSAVSAEEIRAFLAASLAKYKMPVAFNFVDSLPRTPYGKVLKSELREGAIR
jgi:fatty-acyl-CoA synthase